MPENKSVLVDGKVESKKKDKQLLVYERKRLKDKITATLTPQSWSLVEDSGNPHLIILESTDLDTLIAIRKGLHHVPSIVHLIFYHILICILLTKPLSRKYSVSILNHVHDELTDPK